MDTKEILAYEEKNIKSDQMWDADTVGPVFFCIYCFHKMTDYPAYCSHCGHTNTIYKAPKNVRDQKYCNVHSQKLAVGWCALCAKPICELCDSQGKNPSEYFDYTVNLKCKSCLDKSEKLAQDHEGHLKNGVCCRHEDVKAVNNCITCNSPICENCSYSLETSNGIFFKKIENYGPYCLTCLRRARIEKAFKSKVSWKPYKKI